MIEEITDRWIFNLRGVSVAGVAHTPSPPRFTLELVSGVLIEISGQVDLTRGPRSARDAQCMSIQGLREVIGATLVSAVVFKTGSSRFVFSTGHHLNTRVCEGNMRVAIRKQGAFEWFYADGVASLKVTDEA
jgi:hypothetical protein